MFFRRKKTTLESLMTIDDLSQRRSEIKKISLKDKKNIKILFLDDEGYDIETLKSLGYIDLTKKYKYENMDDFIPYDIIFCDVTGIAEDLDPIFQGAALAKKIKSTFPEKIVIIFSAKNQSVEINQFSECVDDIISKNITPSDMADRIDIYINYICDPIFFWNNMKKKLMQQNTSSKTIAELEHYYVRSILFCEDNTKFLRMKEKEKSNDFYVIAINTIINIVTSYLSLGK